MTKDRTNPEWSAFPSGTHDTDGLTKREYFAALALQGLLAGRANYDLQTAGVAESAVQNADALIAALNGYGEDSEEVKEQ